MEIHSWCGWRWEFTPTLCRPRVFTRRQRVLVRGLTIRCNVNKITRSGGSVKFKINNVPVMKQWDYEPTGHWPKIIAIHATKSWQPRVKTQHLNQSQGWFYVCARTMRDVLQSNAISHWLGADLESALSRERWSLSSTLNTFQPRQDGRQFADNYFIFCYEKGCIFIEISLKFNPKSPINNKPTLVQIMTWRRSGDKSLSEPMVA